MSPSLQTLDNAADSTALSVPCTGDCGLLPPIQCVMGSELADTVLWVPCPVTTSLVNIKTIEGTVVALYACGIKRGSLWLSRLGVKLKPLLICMIKSCKYSKSCGRVGLVT